MSPRTRRIAWASRGAAVIAGLLLATGATAEPAVEPAPEPAPAAVPASVTASTVEEIYILRSIREPLEPTADWCAASKTGFAPFPNDAERFYSFWSLELRPEDSRVVDAHRSRAAELHACFGGTDARERQNFYAEIRLGQLSFVGKGECLALGVDFPEKGLYPVRCQLKLEGLPAPYVGGVLTTNTLTSGAAPFGGDSIPPGYTQASIATIRLWKAR